MVAVSCKMGALSIRQLREVGTSIYIFGRLPVGVQGFPPARAFPRTGSPKENLFSRTSVGQHSMLQVQMTRPEPVSVGSA